MDIKVVEKICDLYNSSDLLAFEYILQADICNVNQTIELYELLDLNSKLFFESNCSINETEYHNRKKNLLSSLGVTFVHGDAIPSFD